MKLKLFCVYIHVNKINGKMYIGITSMKPKYRWNNGNGYSRNLHFNLAIKKYGWDSFLHIVVIDKLTKKEAQTIEKNLIKDLNTRNGNYGYNITLGGLNPPSKGHPMSLAQKEKLSLLNKGLKNPHYGKLPWNKGKKLTDEHKKKVSLKTKLAMKNLSELSKRKMSLAHKDKPSLHRKKIRCLLDNMTFDSVLSASLYYNIDRRCISKVLNGQCKSTHNKHFIKEGE